MGLAEKDVAERDPGGSGTPNPDRRRAELVGGLCALGAFLVWGFLPVYFKLIASVGPLEILAHRVVWSVLLVGALVTGLGRLGEVLNSGRSWRRLRVYLATTGLITFNWLVFIWAVLNHRIVDASLGYFINPLVNVLLGVAFLGERLNRWQLTAVAMAAAGVTSLVLSHGQPPWLGLSLAFSFGLYALVRKKAAVDPLVGLLIETALLAPVALGYLLWLGGDGAFVGAGPGMAALLALGGLITAVPLILFMIGARRLPLSTIGVMQYLAPSCQLLLGVLVYGEPFTPAHALAFGCIWLALAVFTADAFRRRPRAARPPP
jgi:chloramphenicol-sensitive protein RarD